MVSCRSLAPAATLLAVVSASACTALFGPVPCETDEHCPEELACRDALCVADAPDEDAGSPPRDGGGELDAGDPDEDAGAEDDAGTPPPDAGDHGDAGADAGPSLDAGADGGVNLPPVAVDDAATTPEDPADPLSFDVLANDSDPEGGALTLVAVAEPDNGTVTYAGDGTVSYTPALDFFGTDSFTYEASDEDGATSMATVTVTVTPVDDLPVAPDATWYVSIDGSVTDTLPGYDVDGDTLTFELVTSTMPTLGAVTLDDAAAGTVTYTPTGDNPGADELVYRVNDGMRYSAPGTIRVVVIAKTWTGAVSNAWEVDGNWTPAGVPDASDSVWIRADAQADPVLGAEVEIDSLLIDDGAFLELLTYDLTITRGYRSPLPAVSWGITGSGWVQLSGTVLAVRGALPRLRVLGDTSLDGELVVDNELEVPKDSILRVGAHRLEVGGAASVAYDSASEGLVMTDPAGSAHFFGPLTFDGLNNGSVQTNTLTAGEVWLYGDLTTVDTAADARTLSPSGTRFVFAGADQTVDIAQPSPLRSRFADVHAAAASQVTLATPIAVTGRLTMEDTAAIAGPRVDYAGQLPDTAPGYAVTESFVVGNVVQTADARVHGDVIVEEGATVRVGATTARFFQDLTLVISTATTGLILDDAAGSVTVDGTATFEGTTSSSPSTQRLTEGVLRLRGDLVQTHYSVYAGVFVAENGTRVVFDGDAQQTVSFEGPAADASRFGDVRFENPVGVRFDTATWVAGDVEVAEGAVLDIASPLHVEGAFEMEGPATVAGADALHMKGDVPDTAAGYAVTTLVDGSAQLPADRRFHGALLDVTVDGSLDVNGHRLELLGDYRQETDTDNQDGLQMDDPTDEVVVHGDVAMTCDWSSGTTATRFVAGTLRVGGDFEQVATSSEELSFVATGTLVVFDGDALQTVSFTDPDRLGSRFASVRIENPVGVAFATDAWVRDGLAFADGAAARLDAALHADGSVDFAGAAALTGAGELRLYSTVPATPAGTDVPVRVAGNVALAADVVVQAPSFGTRAGGQLDLQGHTLEVIGDLDVESDTSNDGVRLNDPAAELIVRGDARFYGLSSSSNTNGNLSAGTLRLFGGLAETADASFARVFYSTGTLVVFEAGQAVSVSLANDDPTYARFHDVTVEAGTTVTATSDIQVQSDLLIRGLWAVDSGTLTSVSGDLTVEAGGELQNDGAVTFGGMYMNAGVLSGTGGAPQQN